MRERFSQKVFSENFSPFLEVALAPAEHFLPGRCINERVFLSTSALLILCNIESSRSAVVIAVQYGGFLVEFIWCNMLHIFHCLTASGYRHLVVYLGDSCGSLGCASHSFFDCSYCKSCNCEL